MTAPSKLPVFAREALQDILTSAVSGEINVVVAPPRSGKSTMTRELLTAALLGSDPLQRVLWAVGSISTEDNLADEPLKDFKERHVETNAVYSEDHACNTLKMTKADYSKQFDWKAGASVKAISHARVGQVFTPSKHHTRKLTSADLLVIDEDPFSALVLDGLANSKPVLVAELAALGNHVGKALYDQAETEELAGTTKQFQTLKKKVTGYGLFCPAFWARFLSMHPGAVDVPYLTADLKTLGVREAAHVSQCFADDLELARLNPDQPPQRFGLDWEGPDYSGGARLRYNLLRPLEFDLPVVILDGYASETYYRAMFPGRVVQMHHFDPGRRLDIECAPVLTVESSRERTGVQVEGRKHIAAEVAQRVNRSGERTLILTSLQLKHPDSDWTTFLQTAFKHEGLSLEGKAKTGHWHAGRGSNIHAGSNVYALHRPRYNQRHKHYTLSALFPQEPERRQEFSDYLAAAEALQMLHRGRQTQIPTPLLPPRVVLAYRRLGAQHFFKPFADRVTLHDYQPIQHFEPSSNKPRWREGMKALGSELLDHLPAGLPRELLEALPCSVLRAVSSKRSLRISICKERLSSLALTLPAGSHLHDAHHRSESWRYTGMPLGGSDNNKKMEKEAMAALGLNCYRVKGHGRPVIYARSEADAEQASADLKVWLDSGSLPTSTFTPAVRAPTPASSTPALLLPSLP